MKENDTVFVLGFSRKERAVGDILSPIQDRPQEWFEFRGEER